MSSLSRPEPPPRPPILTDVRNSAGEIIATLARSRVASSAILRDAQGRMRTVIDSENPPLEAMRYIENHITDFQPNREGQQCQVPSDPQQP